MGGTVGVDTPAEGGARFTVRLPVKVVVDSPGARRAVRGLSDEVVRMDTILLVEDHDLSRDALARRLSAAGLSRHVRR